jgi:hypothetical protein
VFEKSLALKFQKIFGLAKVTYDRPGESQEQEGLFISITEAKNRIIDAREIARVTGTLHVFANSDKLPYGYFSKAIAEASADDKRGLFFYDGEENIGTFRNICERKISFIFLYDSQYDPAIGELNAVNLTYSES